MLKITTLGDLKLQLLVIQKYRVTFNDLKREQMIHEKLSGMWHAVSINLAIIIIVNMCGLL